MCFIHHLFTALSILSPFHSFPFSPLKGVSHLFTFSPFHLSMALAILSPFPLFTLSTALAILSPFHLFTLSPFHSFTFSLFHFFTFSPLLTPKVFIPLHEKDENYHRDTRL